MLKPLSVRSYLNIIGILHKEFGLPNPLPVLNNWPLKSLLTGINRSKGLTPNQKQPITPAILQQLHSTLDLTTSQDVSFWAICLVAFYGMFRKSHLLPTAPHLFNSKKQLTKGDFTIYACRTLITIRWSKTSQFRERVVEIPLPLIPASSLCPTSAIGHAFRFTAPGSSRDMQAFNWVDSANVLHVFTYTAFVTQWCYHLSTLGLDPRSYAGHSFRRGSVICVPIGRTYRIN